MNAKKGYSLRALPPILTLSLKRHVYDMRTYNRVKVNSKFRFPLVLDMREYMEKEGKNKNLEVEINATITATSDTSKHIWIEDLYNKDLKEKCVQQSIGLGDNELVYDLTAVIIHRGGGKIHFLYRYLIT